MLPKGSSGMALLKLDKTIKKQVKEDNNVIYGAQAIKKHIGFAARPTKDYDILSKTPRRSARKLERTLDRQSGRDAFFIKPAMHPGTFKVKHKGMDNRKNTEDDMEIADFTRPTRRYKTKRMNGIKHVTLSEIRRDKRKALRDPAFEFRHAKDKEDLERIGFAKKHNIKYRR